MTKSEFGLDSPVLINLLKNPIQRERDGDTKRLLDELC